VVIGAMICAIKPKVAKSGRSAGQKWAVLEFEDLEGKIEGMCFADVFDAIAKDDQQRGRTQPAIRAERIVFVKAKVDRRRETPCVIVTDLIPIEEAPSRLTTAVKLNLDPLRHTPEMLVSLKPIFQRHKGGCDVYAQLVVAGKGAEAAGSTASSLPPKKLTLRFDPALRVSPGPDFARDIESVLGTGALDLVGDGLKRLRRLEQQKLFTSADLPPAEVAAEAAGITDAIDPEVD
jgi:DNA polymerase III alpha subunit